MDKEFIDYMIKVCSDKISKKGDNVGISFYVFFQNKNKNPDLLFSVARWWIYDNKLDHFEKAKKNKKIVERAKGIVA